MEARSNMRMRTITTFLTLLSVAVLTSGCGALAEPVMAEQRAVNLTIFNNTPHVVQYYVLEKNAARYTHWSPCNHPEMCGETGIRPGLLADVLYERIYRWYPGCEVVVNWWYLVADSTFENGYRTEGPFSFNIVTPFKAVFGTD